MTWIQTANGRAVDLVAPKPESILAIDIAEHLAKLPRYNGATPGAVYSVAQHSCYAADIVFARTQDRLFAADALLHDAHEYVIGDDPSPKKRALIELGRELYGDAFAEQMKTVMQVMRRRVDEAIYSAFGMKFDLSAARAASVHRVDVELLETEKRDLMAPEPQPWFQTGVAPLQGFNPVKGWSWELAQNSFMQRFRKYVELR